LTVDEVLTCKPMAGHFLELRKARIMTGHAYRYLSGVAQASSSACRSPCSWVWDRSVPCC
jgi:hypothetical protein